MNKRKFPVTEEWFNINVKYMLDMFKDARGCKAKVSDYIIFCAGLYVLRTGIPWRDLPEDFGPWHTVYDRFNRFSKRGIFWYILLELQKLKKITIPVSIADSTTIQVHRHAQGGDFPVAETLQG